VAADFEITAMESWPHRIVAPWSLGWSVSTDPNDGAWAALFKDKGRVKKGSAFSLEKAFPAPTYFDL
jgi:hypothetical protein